MLRSVALRYLRTGGVPGVAAAVQPYAPPAALLAQCARMSPYAAHGSLQKSWSRRWFSSSGSSSSDRHCIEGRYGRALLAASQEAKALDRVFADVQGLQEALKSSSDFLAFAKTPGVTAETKVSVVQHIADHFGLHAVTKNFLCTVAENKRMVDLPKILSVFEELYRATRGEVRCFITSAQVRSSMLHNLHLK